MIHTLRCCDTGIVAGRTIVRIDARMVIGDTRKGGEVRGDVAGRTIEARRHMTRMLAKRNITVMAERAITGIDTRMAEYRAGKAYGVVTGNTILVIGIGGYVIIEFTHADPVIVAARATAEYAGMVIAARAECPGCMTGLAILGANGHVGIERRAQRYTRRIETVVAIITPL